MCILSEKCLKRAFQGVAQGKGAGGGGGEGRAKKEQVRPRAPEGPRGQGQRGEAKRGHGDASHIALHSACTDRGGRRRTGGGVRVPQRGQETDGGWGQGARRQDPKQPGTETER